jgi:radical SAM enzyme (rSAM/lipoprotein system)
MSVENISLRKRLALRLFNQYKKNETKIHQLNYILWETTLKCNLSCRHCGSDCKKDTVVKDMPITDFLKAIDQITPIVNPNKTMIVFTGGEALVRPDLEKAGKALYDRGFPWGVVTNGMLLNEKRIQLLCNAGLRSLTISLDGLEESHNWLRGNPKSFNNAIQAIRLMQHTTDVRYDVVTCVNQRNFNELDAIKKLLIDAGVKEWRLFTIFPIGRAQQDAELKLTPVQFKGFFDFIAEQRKTNTIKVNYGCEGFLGNYEGEVRDNFFFCRAGINVASILADGSISACPNLRANFIQGNIYKDNMAEVWQNRYQVFRDRSWAKKGICADCGWFDHCQGNGMHLHHESTGELMMCHLQRIKEGEDAINVQ